MKKFWQKIKSFWKNHKLGKRLGKVVADKGVDEFKDRLEDATRKSERYSVGTGGAPHPPNKEVENYVKQRPRETPRYDNQRNHRRWR